MHACSTDGSQRDGAGWERDILSGCMCLSDVTGRQDGLHNHFEMM